MAEPPDSPPPGRNHPNRLSRCARRSDDTDACHSQGAQRTGREHPQAGSCQTAKDDGGKPGVRFLARSKRGTRFRTASLLGGTKQRRRRFCWGETKEGDAVGGARLTIEIGAEFPIGIKDRHLARAKRQNANGWASNSKRTASGEIVAFPQRPARTPKSARPW